MTAEKVHFMFTLSAEGTRLLQEGKLILSSGGLRRSDGSLYEMAIPVCFDPNSVSYNMDQPAEEVFRTHLEMITSRLDRTMQDVNALKDIAWINYAVNYRTYEMTYQGFQLLIGQLDDISVQLTRVEKKIDNKEFNDRLELANRYKNKLKSIAGYIETKNFNASASFLQIATTLDEIAAYFDRLHNELVTRTSKDQIVLWNMVFLFGAYTYVVRRYSALYYYENMDYPPNYEKWVEAVSNIAKDARVINRFKYYLRVNSNCSLEDVFVASDRVLFNLQGFIRQVEFDNKYVLQHTKEEYFSIDKQIQAKINQRDYQIIDNHLCIEL